MIDSVPSFDGLNCTINTTENCNLRCKYCYEINKKNKDISLDKCKKFVDIILSETCKKTSKMNDHLKHGIIFDFIGGDSLMSPKLLDDICTYVVTQLQVTDHPCKYSYRFSISSNGTLFENKDVRDFCEKWNRVLSLGVSIDGCPEIHDMNRIFPDGSGSMSTIMKWWPWFKEHFPIEAMTTKSTLSKNSIPYLYDSLVFMHETLGLKYINQNFIMEDSGCTEEDYKLFDEQMGKCVDYVYDHKDEMHWSMIDRTFLVRKPPEAPLSEEGHCGSGSMPTLSIDGNIYPCFRWLPHTLQDYESCKKFVAGNIEDGLYPNVFDEVSKKAARSRCTKDPKCFECIYEPCCAYCIGGCYSEYGDFIRTTHICEITKIQAKWAEIYWSRYDKSKN